MGIVLDTSILIEVEKGRLSIERILALTELEEVAIAAITASELLHGIERAKPAQIREERIHFVEWVVTTFDVVEFGLAEARLHARLWAALSATGRRIGYHDMIIAATALNLGFSLATRNEQEFCRVPGLSLFPV